MTNPMIPEYPAKHFAEWTPDDARAARRYSQGKIHARQGRNDLIGDCPHYDAGYAAGLAQ